MSFNPYEPPSASEAIAGERSASVRVDLFQVNTSSFACRSFTPESLAQRLQAEILTCCQQQGLDPSDSPEADVHITGTVHSIDEGSQILRYLLPLLAGASLVHVEGTIRVKGEPLRPFKQVIRSRVGAFGGRGLKMVELALLRIGLFVAGEAANCVSPTAQRATRSVAGYFSCAGGAALLVSFMSAILGYRWASALPETKNSIKHGEIPIWASVVALAAFTTIVLLATAFAPTRILKSRAMVWLVARSGTKSIVALRAILLVLAFIAGAVSMLCFVVAKGS